MVTSLLACILAAALAFNPRVALDRILPVAMLTLTNLLILLLLGAFLIPVLRQVFTKDYGTYLGAVFVLTVLLFFFLNLPRYVNCGLAVSIWLVLTFPLRPLGLCLVLILVTWLEGMKKLEDDKKTRKKMTDRLMAILVILALSSTPAAARWFAEKTGQEIYLVTSSTFANYVPSVQGLAATTRVLEGLLYPVYYPFRFCAFSPDPYPNMPRIPRRLGWRH